MCIRRLTMLIYMTVGVVAAVLIWAGLRWRRRQGEKVLLGAHMIAAEELHELWAGVSPPRVFDVRQPLDLLAYSETIPGSERIPPKDVLAHPELIPRDVDTVVYCTCPGDKTALDILGKALGLGYSRVKILRGGLEEWKAKGYPVEPYETAFRLDTPV
jgi:rhodanese-related sulfurtransferase